MAFVIGATGIRFPRVTIMVKLDVDGRADDSPFVEGVIKWIYCVCDKCTLPYPYQRLADEHLLDSPSLSVHGSDYITTGP